MNAAAIRYLAEKGLSAVEIAECADLLEAKKDRTGAERQARYRERKRNAVTSRVTPPNEKDNLTPPCEKPKPNGLVKGSGFRLPDDIPAEPWEAWEEMRAKIRKPLTDRAKAMAVTELRKLRDDDGWPPGDVLNHCTMNSYQGIFPPKREKNNGKSSDPNGEAFASFLSRP